MPEGFPHELIGQSSVLQGAELAETISETLAVYRADGLRYSCKAHTPIDRRLREAYALASAARDPDGLIAKPIEAFEAEGRLVAIAPWIEGERVLPDSPELMIRVFEELARFHLANPSDGPYTSMYADGAYFDSIKGMLDAELDYHRRFLFEADAFPAFEAAIAPLADDLPCVVHGDVHGWNAIRGGGRAILVDVEWMSRGFALLDFEHLGEGEGEVGLPEGIRRSCIQAYFNARGCDPEEAARLAFARSALDIIRMSTFYKWKGLEREWRSSGDALRRLSARA